MVGLDAYNITTQGVKWLRRKMRTKSKHEELSRFLDYYLLFRDRDEYVEINVIRKWNYNSVDKDVFVHFLPPARDTVKLQESDDVIADVLSAFFILLTYTFTS
nr:hypothetical protein [Tanacetum cinerariifolium]